MSMQSNEDPPNGNSGIKKDHPEQEHRETGEGNQPGSDDTVILSDGAKSDFADEIARLQAQARKEFATPPKTSDTNPQLQHKNIPDLVEIKIPQPVKPKKTPLGLFIILAVVLVVVIGYFVNDFLMEQKAIKRSDVNQSTAESDLSSSEIPDPGVEQPVPKGPDAGIQLPISLIEGQFRGEVPAEGVVFSPKEDAELAALVDSMRIHAEIIFGIKQRTSRGVETHLCEGNLRGFRVKSTQQIKGGKELSREISVVSPKKGSLLIKDGVLSEAKNISFETFFQELADAGIWVSEPRHLPGNIVKARIQLKEWQTNVADDLLIKENGIGRIHLKMASSDISSSIPSGFYSIKKSMMYEEKLMDVFKVFNEKKEQMYFLNTRDDKILNIQLLDPMFKTASNVGINNTLGDMMIRYPGVKLDFIENGQIPFITVAGLKAKFFLEENRIRKGVSVFPLETKITSIFIGELQK